MAHDDWAIVVGITDYSVVQGDARLKITPLKSPHLDAQDFCDWLTSPAGGGLAPDGDHHIWRIVWPDGAAVSSEDQVEPAIRRAVRAIQQTADLNASQGKPRRVGRRLYVYMAGHGFSPREDQTALLMPDFSADCMGPPYHWLGEYTANWFYEAGYFDEVLLFMDCCRRIQGFPALHMPFPPKRAVNYQQGKRFFVLAAKRGLETWEQKRPDGEVRGIFTTALLNGLRIGGQVTTRSLRDYLVNTLQAAAPEVREVDDFVINQAHPLTYPVTIHLPPGAIGTDVEVQMRRWVASRWEVKAQTTAAADTWQVHLEPDIYKAVVPALHLGMLFEVDGEGEVHVRF